MPHFDKRTFELLGQFAQNNNKDWFDANKAEYLKTVREPFAQLLEELSSELGTTDLPYKGGEKTMFRVNRDVRFSLDKSPYNVHVSGLLNPTGTKSEANALLFFHLEADSGFAVAGLYHPSTDRLEELRNAMLEKEEDFSRVLRSLEVAGLTLDNGEATKTMPRAFKEYAEHNLAPQLKLKNLMVRIELSPADWMAENLIQKLKNFALDAKPLLEFIESN